MGLEKDQPTVMVLPLYLFQSRTHLWGTYLQVNMHKKNCVCMWRPLFNPVGSWCTSILFHLLLHETSAKVHADDTQLCVLLPSVKCLGLMMGWRRAKKLKLNPVQTECSIGRCSSWSWMWCSPFSGGTAVSLKDQATAWGGRSYFIHLHIWRGVIHGT